MADTPNFGPQQQFFADPALDRMMGMVLAMATELYVTRDRLRGLETLLAEKGIVAAGALDRPPDAAETQARIQELAQFVSSVMTPLLGQKTSNG